MPIGVSLSCNQQSGRELIPCLKAEVLAQRTDEFFSPLSEDFRPTPGN
ncbi:MAG: hypothetical protein JGK17_21260 [Microcoleus sp. PH2017_10_PVI_O_A]|nr:MULTISPECIES: hypothetical protein [unclassified Microcoleus]MCC3531534.1 hypothetical protein [Microcoleus sp. PH2017_21_RUC_O_A]MCC3408066.1 hypothetical protein [Microcoleus sp. PH2017_10_PVI_O_A]MCC3462186.1 hypothetical protein [Microcoleus sp. PH2017_11_PCY_U_A]MCC3543870.1 hypothetical protein [Microcoleus sp. PH2017_22_RUC_O_B]MCC3562824.1 hypothetical protein [Microcoleus sp. PH2017_27_LUM_O_A]